MRNLALSFTFVLTLTGLARAENPGQPRKTTVIKAGRLIDTRSGRALADQAIVVEGRRIKSVGNADEVLRSAPGDAVVLDLSGATVLPGLMDCHTHVLLQGDITQEDY